MAVIVTVLHGPAAAVGALLNNGEVDFERILPVPPALPDDGTRAAWKAKHWETDGAYDTEKVTWDDDPCVAMMVRFRTSRVPSKVLGAFSRLFPAHDASIVFLHGDSHRFKPVVQEVFCDEEPGNRREP